jgi:hypothetical protein
MAFLRAPSESLVDPAGARFFQKREWLMCPGEVWIIGWRQSKSRWAARPG